MTRARPDRQEKLRRSGGKWAWARHYTPAEGSRPGLEALRLAVHEPDRIGQRLERFLFIEELHARAFDALASAETISQAIASVDEEDPEVATLLRRLTVEESAADADDCVVQLIRAAAHRSLVALQAEARLDPARVAEVAADSGQVALDLERIGTTDCRARSGGPVASLATQEGDGRMTEVQPITSTMPIASTMPIQAMRPSRRSLRIGIRPTARGGQKARLPDAGGPRRSAAHCRALPRRNR